MLAICGLLAICVSLFSYYRQAYYLLFFGILGSSAFIVKKGKITIYDWLIVLVVTIPLHTLRIGGQTHFLRLTEVAFIPFFFSYLIKKRNDAESFKIRKEFFWIFAFLIVNILAISKSLYPLVSIKKVAILGYLILFCYLVSDMFKTIKKEELVIKAMIGISACSAVLAVFQSFLPQLHILSTKALTVIGGITIYRASAGWKDPNYYALYLGMNAALCLSFLVSSRIKKTTFLRVCFFLQIAGIIATFSRMGILCFIFVLVYMMFSYNKRKLGWIMLIIMMLSGVGIVSSIEKIYEKYPLAQAYIFRQPKLETLQQYPRLILVHRWDAFRANWKMFLDNPFLGVGPFMAMDNYAEYRPKDALWYTREMLDSHNQYLQLLAEKGIFGFLFFIGFIFLVWKRLSKYIGQKKGPQAEAIAIGLRGSLFVYLVACLVAQTTHEVQFWLVVGLSLALFNIGDEKINEQ